MEGYRKLIATYTPIVVGIINSIFVGVNVPLPKDYEWTTLAPWGLVIVMQYIPTIISLVAGMFYVRKNVEQAKAFAAVDEAKAYSIPTPAPNITLSSQSPATGYVVAVPSVTTTTAEVAQVKDRIAAAKKLINKETKWDVLMGIWVDKINDAKEKMLKLNPSMGDMEAVNAVIQQYAKGIKSEEDCANVRSIMGLPGVLHAKNDVLILQSMKEAEQKGTLGKAMSETYLNAAINGIADDIVKEAILRVQNDALPIGYRRLALQEFGLSQDVADRALFSGGQVMINHGGSWRDFNGYDLAGIEL